MATNESPTETIAHARPCRETRPPAHMRDNGEPSVKPRPKKANMTAPQKPIQKATEEVDSSDDDIEITTNFENDDDDKMPPPSELSRATSRSSMISLEDDEKDCDDEKGSDQSDAEEDDIAFIGMLMRPILSKVLAYHLLINRTNLTKI